MPDVHKSAVANLFKGFCLLILIFFTSCSSVQKGQFIILDMYYPDARKLILQSGWKPAEGLPPYNEIGAAAHVYRDMGYDEVQDCSGSGLELCNFYFQNEKGEYLRIGTEGEENGHHRYPRVIYAAIRDKID